MPETAAGDTARHDPHEAFPLQHNPTRISSGIWLKARRHSPCVGNRPTGHSMFDEAIEDRRQSERLARSKCVVQLVDGRIPATVPAWFPILV